MTDKEKYIIFCRDHRDIPCFYQPKWLDVVCNGTWDVVCAYDQSDDIVAFMPVYHTKKYSISAITNPRLTPYQGVYFVERSDFVNQQKKQSHLFKALHQIIHKLGNPAFFKVKFHTSFDMWLPFYYAGFKQTTFYSYLLHDIKNHEKIFNGFKSTRRNIIRKAEITLRITESEDIDILYSLLQKTFNKKSEKIPFDLSYLQRINDVMKEQRTILLAVDEKQNIHAGIFILFDQKRAYNLLFGTDFRYSDSGASSFLMWEAIKYASKKVDIFDFEGSRLPTIQPFFQSFGGTPTPYFEIYRAKNKVWEIIFSFLKKM
ncbi:MAG: GNAT family N-acetyltransferase [Saprospiraceae bacterium]|nr:GNAT family N-acetyltransferase [Saprospiraceae bacterium]MBK8371939.1 GNAT family N-acetyltransferase [Saprospiraceae bacterium]MBK8547209.1 GNAT family N-acetyltransferase [Saprospiraceae bacterium]MBK8818419.1 GNAT family N-acetyltransferase [Saprospiraceae bacterium]